MGKYRVPSEKNKYYIQREDYLTSVHYALRYPLWVEELRLTVDTGKAIRYDKLTMDKVFGTEERELICEVKEKCNT